MSSKINKKNYGRYIVDYYDGNLSSEEEKSLLRFLDMHPALKEEFDQYATAPFLEKESVGFSNKSRLKQPEIKTTDFINSENYPGYFVLAADNELSENEKQVLNNFLKQNPGLTKELELLAKAKVVPDTSVVFKNKERLKKRLLIFRYQKYVAAVAAVLLLFFGLRMLLPRLTGLSGSVRSVAVVQPLPKKKVMFAVKYPSVTIHPEKQFSRRTAIKNVNRKTKEKLPNETPLSVRKVQPVTKLAAAGISPVLDRQPDYFPLLFPETTVSRVTYALSGPVTTEKPKAGKIIRHTLARPFSELASVFAFGRKKGKKSDLHDKGFIKVLEKGVSAVNLLTDNDVWMVKTYDANGRLIDYQLLSDNFSIYHPVKTASR